MSGEAKVTSANDVFGANPAEVLCHRLRGRKALFDRVRRTYVGLLWMWNPSVEKDCSRL